MEHKCNFPSTIIFYNLSAIKNYLTPRGIVFVPYPTQQDSILTNFLNGKVGGRGLIYLMKL